MVKHESSLYNPTDDGHVQYHASFIIVLNFLANVTGWEAEVK